MNSQHTIWREGTVYVINEVKDLEDLVDSDILSILLRWEKDVKRKISDSYFEGYDRGFVDGQKG